MQRMSISFGSQPIVRVLVHTYVVCARSVCAYLDMRVAYVCVCARARVCVCVSVCVYAAYGPATSILPQVHRG